MSEASAILRTSGLTKQFGSFTAVDDVDFAIERNETTALIGPNGAGKTTFQNLITGKLQPTAGSITFEGEDITGIAPHERARRGILRKFQVTSVLDDETVLDNMRLAVRGRTGSPASLLRVRDDGDVADRIDQLLGIAGLRERAEDEVSTLSHGEKQWLEIVMAVAAEPTLLLLDEPTSGMSVGETNDTAAFIEEIRRTEDVSILIIEHDMAFIRQVSNAITVLHRGAIIADGTIDEVEADETVQRIYLGAD